MVSHQWDTARWNINGVTFTREGYLTQLKMTEKAAKKIEKACAKKAKVRVAKVLARKDTKQFTIFKKLPVELRFKIWGYAAKIPRIILCQHSVQAKTPAILHANREARQEALKYYTELHLYPFSFTRRIYLNIELDTVFFGDASWNGNSKLLDPIIIRSKDLHRVKNLAMTDAVFKSFVSRNEFTSQRKKILRSGLKSIVIVWQIEKGMRLINKNLVLKENAEEDVDHSDWFIRPKAWKEGLDGEYKKWKHVSIAWATAKKGF